MTECVIIYLLGAAFVGCGLSTFGWTDGIPRWRKILTTVLAIALWPITWLLFAVS